MMTRGLFYVSDRQVMASKNDTKTLSNLYITTLFESLRRSYNQIQLEEKRIANELQNLDPNDARLWDRLKSDPGLYQYLLNMIHSADK